MNKVQVTIITHDCRMLAVFILSTTLSVLRNCCSSVARYPTKRWAKHS